MTVTFKAIKYKHQKEAQRLLAEGPDDAAVDAFVMGLVESWDYRDAETGEPVPVGQPDELTIEQYNEVLAEFNRLMGVGTDVPKASASPSRSGSTRSKAARKSPRTRRSG
jgi:hypothetical protein